jgi:hypothetical protein
MALQHALAGNKTTSLPVGSELSRMLTAAVINSQFRQRLLANPDEAVEAGFAGEPFSLASEDKNSLGSIHATSLADFAFQLNRTLEQRQAKGLYPPGD